VTRFRVNPREPHALRLAKVILTEFSDFVVLFKVAVVAIFPHVATAGIEERVLTPAIRELDVVEVPRRHGGLGLKDWFEYDRRKKQSDEREDRLRVKVNAHVRASSFSETSISPLAMPSSVGVSDGRCNAKIVPTATRAEMEFDPKALVMAWVGIEPPRAF
jgi:hypothetical protein